MDVDEALGHQIQYPLRQDPAISYHRYHIRLQSPQFLHGGIITKILRLVNRDLVGDGHLLYRGKHHLHATTLGTIRLCINTDYLKAVGNDLF